MFQGLETPFITHMFGVFGVLFSAFSFTRNSRHKILFYQIISALNFIIHFLLLNAIIGALANLIIIIRNFVFDQKMQKKWANSIFWLYLFIVISIGLFLLNDFNRFISLFPFIAVIIGTYARWNDNSTLIKKYSLLSASLWIPYDLVIGSVDGLINQIIIIGVLMYAIILQAHPKQ